MSYAEKRDGKLTGWFYGEVFVKDVRFRHRFDKKKDADGYELYVKLTGTEPPSLTTDNTQGTSGRTFAVVAAECKAKGGPDGKWLNGRDQSIIQRVDFCVGVLGHLDILAVTRGQLDKITEKLRKTPKAPGQRGAAKGAKGLSNATINRYLNAASAVLTFAVLHQYIPSKPAVPLLDESGSRKRDILKSYDQEDAILSAMEAAGDRVEAVCVRVLVETGIRESELCEELAVDQVTTETDADGNENGWLHFYEDQTKNAAARTVYIRPELAREIRALIAAGKVPDASRLLKRFKAAVKTCGYTGNLVIHSLRHTRNTRLRKLGVDMKVRMTMLGHKSTAASMRYDHVDTDDQLEAAKKVEAARGERLKTGAVLPMRASRSA